MDNRYGRRRFLITATVLTVALAALVSLFAFAPTRQKTAAGPKVAATVFPLYDIVRNIAGDGVQVYLILPPNAEPHTYEPAPSTLRDVRESAAIYEIGHGLDGWVGAISSGIPRITVDRDIQIMAARGETRTEDSAAGSAPETSDDPHYWLTIPNAEKIAGNVAADLTARFPDQGPSFARNLTAYLTKLTTADGEIRSLLAGVKNRQIITLHDAWYYFSAAYGLTVAGTFEPTAGREPTPKWLADLKAAIARTGVKTLYREPQFDSRPLQTFADDNGLTLVVLDDLGGTPGRETYIDLMIANAHAIAQNQ